MSKYSKEINRYRRSNMIAARLLELSFGVESGVRCNDIEFLRHLNDNKQREKLIEAMKRPQPAKWNFEDSDSATRQNRKGMLLQRLNESTKSSRLEAFRRVVTSSVVSAAVVIVSFVIAFSGARSSTRLAESVFPMENYTIEFNIYDSYDLNAVEPYYLDSDPLGKRLVDIYNHQNEIWGVLIWLK